MGCFLIDASRQTVLDAEFLVALQVINDEGTTTFSLRYSGQCLQEGVILAQGRKHEMQWLMTCVVAELPVKRSLADKMMADNWQQQPDEKKIIDVGALLEEYQAQHRRQLQVAQNQKIVHREQLDAEGEVSQ